MTNPTIVWLRRDLRLADQAAFVAALAQGGPVIPVYVLDDETPRHRRMGAPRAGGSITALPALPPALRRSARA
jgi:deoxyribodipyrimidine photo-lyase